MVAPLVRPPQAPLILPMKQRAAQTAQLEAGVVRVSLRPLCAVQPTTFALRVKLRELTVMLAPTSPTLPPLPLQALLAIHAWLAVSAQASAVPNSAEKVTILMQALRTVLQQMQANLLLQPALQANQLLQMETGQSLVISKKEFAQAATSAPLA